MTDEQIDELVTDRWRDSDLFTEKERAVIRWAEAVTNLTAPSDQEAFEELKKHFSDADIVELTYLASAWNLSNRLAEALHLVVEPPGQRITFTNGDRPDGSEGT